MRIQALTLALLGAAAAAPAALAGDPTARGGDDLAAFGPAQLVFPQGSSDVPLGEGRAVSVGEARAHLEFVNGWVRTTLEVDVVNTGPYVTPFQFVMATPSGAGIRDVDAGPCSVPAPEGQPWPDMTFQTWQAGTEAHPSLLEFADAQFRKSNTLLLGPLETRTVKATFTSRSSASIGHKDFVFERTESLTDRTPWAVEVTVAIDEEGGDIYSPTHPLKEHAAAFSKRSYTVLPGPSGRIEAGPIRFSSLVHRDQMAFGTYLFPNPDGPGGWFMALASARTMHAETNPTPRELTLVLDRSGSMAGEKLEQAVDAARQVLEGLEFGEAIQIIDYSADVKRFAARPVIKSKETLPALRAYLDAVKAGGGTNLDGALQLSLELEPLEGFLPVVLFLTDGLPTEGETQESVIRDRAKAANVHGRRVFTFGVGVDVNAPLLDAVATASRGRATYVEPEQSVEVAVAGVFEGLKGPQFTGISFEALDDKYQVAAGNVTDVYPRVLPDLYAGDRLIIVGRYADEPPAHYRITGMRGDESRSFTNGSESLDGTEGNGFVQRLWVMRRIAAIEDELRQLGADPSALAKLKDDPKFGESVTELLSLATCHGVLSDSTAFLAKESTELGDAEELLSCATLENFDNNAVRSGHHGVAQQSNIGMNRGQSWINKSNPLKGRDGKVVDNSAVQTIRGRAYFRRGNRWTDGRLAMDGAECKPDRTVTMGTPAYAELVVTLKGLGRAGELSLKGEVVIQVGEESILVQEPAPPAAKEQYAGPANPGADSTSRGIHH